MCGVLEMSLRPNWQEISEIPPRPPLTGGLGGFPEKAAMPQRSLFGSGQTGLGLPSPGTRADLDQLQGKVIRIQ